MTQRLRRWGRPATLTSLTFALTACSAIRFGSDEPVPDVAGSWVGSVEVDGGSQPGRLTLVQENRRLEASLTVDDLGLTATGRGEIDRDGDVELDLRYATECPGTAALRGRFEAGRLTGSMRASDCTGTYEGRFAFRRR